MTVDEILDLGDRYLAKVAACPGGIDIEGAAEGLRLIRVPFHFNEMNPDQLCASLANVAKTTILAGGGAVIADDHYHAWAWCLQVIYYSGKQFLPVNEEQLIGSALHLALMELPTANVPTHCTAVSHDKFHHLANCGFALLEHVCKAGVPAFIDSSGAVLAAFQLPGGKPYGVGDICSNFGTVLRLFRIRGASPLTARLFEYFLTHLAAVEAAPHGTLVLTKWRNSAMHGSERHTYVGAALLCLALIVVVDKYRGEFEARTEQANRMLEWELAHRQPGEDRGPFNVYPPY